MDQFVEQNLRIIAALLVFLADVVVIFVFIKLRNKFQKLKTNGISTKAKIVSIKAQEKASLIVYSFSDYRGNEVTARSILQKFGPEIVEGGEIDITYENENSKSSAITNTIDQQINIFGILVTVVTGMAFVMPVAVYFILSQ